MSDSFHLIAARGNYRDVGDFAATGCLSRKQCLKGGGRGFGAKQRNESRGGGYNLAADGRSRTPVLFLHFLSFSSLFARVGGRRR